MLEPEVAALHDGAVDHLGVFVEPSLVLLRTSGIDHDVAGAADPLFGAEAELHLALEHPKDLPICVMVRLDTDAGPMLHQTTTNLPWPRSILRKAFLAAHRPRWPL
jgi:hypothetical protein